MGKLIPSPRELEAVTLANHGLSDPEVAERMGLAETTARAYIREASGKLNMVDRGRCRIRPTGLLEVEPGPRLLGHLHICIPVYTPE